MKILADASLPGLLEAFPKPFELSFYKDMQDLSRLLKDQSILLCRAALKVNKRLLEGSTLSYVATASSGTDHIDTNYLEQNEIKLIDAKGANAQAVADYVIASIAYLQRFQGFSGINAGVVGMGEVGSRVTKRLEATGMHVFCYDPPKAAQDPTFISCSVESLKHCDLISIHANLHDKPPYPSHNLFDETLLSQLKPGVVIINAARGGIVNEIALLTQPNLRYCTDVYSNEPAISKAIVDFATLCTPHIAGHSIEAKLRAVHMISEKLHACFSLRPPSWQPTLVNPDTPAWNSENWQDFILSLYNPFNETKLLKAADNVELSFQQLRKAHQNRHEFCKIRLEKIQGLLE
ncbi:Erythronate-4-phosphate dehydrogenase [Legionella massiliensis]|uniref:Erythronate-4-phosphate dehydrogenase n=1 Tax=Legionella massiliensis TaxID=1034943 RepID=A0A078L044_9GAMM|nr:4-phosphoerythronate dehydrogenase [Legionella massiliensis]CDZ78632.1 Erythronate-4-phosphate dehydrogenase [Legionella massiliensis]CEE14370.1 Erythronate-4-phosphate dehydrogenase [Legionella massiliensis]